MKTAKKKKRVDFSFFQDEDLRYTKVPSGNILFKYRSIKVIIYKQEKRRNEMSFSWKWVIMRSHRQYSKIQDQKYLSYIDRTIDSKPSYVCQKTHTFSGKQIQTIQYYAQKYNHIKINMAEILYLLYQTAKFYNKRQLNSNEK